MMELWSWRCWKMVWRWLSLVFLKVPASIKVIIILRKSEGEPLQDAVHQPLEGLPGIPQIEWSLLELQEMKRGSYGHLMNRNLMISGDQSHLSDDASSSELQAHTSKLAFGHSEFLWAKALRMSLNRMKPSQCTMEYSVHGWWSRRVRSLIPGDWWRSWKAASFLQPTKRWQGLQSGPDTGDGWHLLELQ